MRDLSNLTFHPTSEKIVEILCRKTQNNDPEFFRNLLSYFEGKVAATMRVKLATKDRGEIPVNQYAISLAPSGYGKTYSSNIIEEQLIHHFRERFYSETYPVISEENLARLAIKRAVVQDIGEDDALLAVQEEFESLGKLAFQFDSGTPAAIKQMRHKLLMGGAGSINLEIDEIGSNLTGNGEALNTLLELYDVGRIKQKLTKNTKENTRSEEIDGRTPTNLLMYGTPNKLFDAGKTEDEFYSFLETGYARRCTFSFTNRSRQNSKLTPEEIYDALIDPVASQYLQDTAVEWGKLADITNIDKVITVDKSVSILYLEYRKHCETIAQEMGAHQEIAKAEMCHRYFKCLKLAGIYAFLDGDSFVSKDNYYHAIKLVEASGVAFSKLLTRDRPYAKLAKYLGEINTEVTMVDLCMDLPFFKGSVSARNDLLLHAAAWGHKNHIIIKRIISGGIEFITGSTLKKTDLTRLVLSYSNNISDGYKNANVKWEDIHKLTQQPLKHWISHHTLTGHRSEEELASGFDLVVLDIDEGSTIDEVASWFKDYKFMAYTTKRHSSINQRFRVILPMNYHLNLTKEEYKEFMANIFEWVPFQVDTQTSQRSRKWLSYNGKHFYNTGDKLLDARMFIPKTSKNDERKQFIATYQTMTNMERWFLDRSGNGNRNNQLARYGLLMVDLGYDYNSIKDAVMTMNNKFPDKLKETEIDQTIMLSVNRKIAKLETV